MAALERDDIFTLLDNEESFVERLSLHYEICYRVYNLTPEIAEARLRDAFAAYQKDYRRVSYMEFEGKPLDHFKRSGHLCYWLRRCAPIVEVHQRVDRPVVPLMSDEKTVLLRYANEFTAFDAGFRICRYFEVKRDDLRIMVQLMGSHVPGNRAPRRPGIQEVRLDKEFYQTMGHFLREKNVSPHALYLVYRSIFYGLV